MNWKIEEVPLQERPESLNRWHTKPQTMTIILYRIPIERSASSRTSDPRIQIEQAVVSAAASLLGKEAQETVLAVRKVLENGSDDFCVEFIGPYCVEILI